jgi:catechol 2,3-dioxygenase-like lactoylglutathione lyase family enzyme
MSAPVTSPGPLHRLGLAVDDADATASWFERVLGAGSIATLSSATESAGDPDGGYMRMLSLAGQPFLLMSPSSGGGFLAGFLDRFGPSVHSLAWEIDDLWGVEHLLELRGIRITGVSVEGRHFFMHPKDTHGLLMEWTDAKVGEFGSAEPTVGEIGVPIDAVAWVSAVVEDIDATAELLAALGGATATSDQPVSALERTLQLSMGPVPLRLVTPLSPKSAYSLERGPRWWSVGLRVGDLDAAVAGLERAGCSVVGRDESSAWTDPASTAGLRLQWTQ